MTEPKTQLELDLIGWAIARERKRRHWTQRQFGIITGLSQHTILNLEKGKPANLGTLTVALDALGMSLAVVPVAHEHKWARVCLECGERQVGAAVEVMAGV